MGRPDSSLTNWGRQYDQETIKILIDFFRQVGQDADFNAMYGLLNEQEKNKLEGLRRVATFAPLQLQGGILVNA